MKRILSYLVALVIIVLVNRTWAYTEPDCIQCHEQEGSETQLRITINGFRSTVHGRTLSCLDCHQDIKDDRHFKIVSTQKIDCQRCHEKQNLHAQDGSVTCDACHTPHYIYGVDDPRSSVHWKNLRDTCGKCHPGQTQQTNILSTLGGLHIASHPKQDFARIFSKGMCVGCHQGRAAHGEDVPVNDQNCYKCHVPLAKNSFILGYVHASTDWHSNPVHAFTNYIYIAASLALVVLLVRGFVVFIKKKSQ